MERPDLRRAIENLPPDRRALLERRLLEGHARSTAEAIVSRSGDGPWPLSSAQQRLWLIHQIEPQSAAYNVPRALRYLGSLDVEAFRRALDLIVERHETLRTTFEVRDGLPVQVVGVARPVPLPILDLSADPAATADQARLEAILRDEARRPFDLAADLMLRALLVRLGPREHVVALTMHHIASDGWSARLLSGELTTAYAAFASGTAPALAPLPIQYADYAVWQCGRLAGSALDEPLDYWRRQLDGAEPLDLPTDRPRPPVQSHHGARRARLLPEHLAAAARAFSRQEGVTLFMTLLASWLALLYRYSGQDDVSVGSVIAGRTARPRRI
jgi:non-ribosomal peptide synthetase component F